MLVFFILGIKGKKKQPMYQQIMKKQPEQQNDSSATQEDAQSEILCNLNNLSQDVGNLVPDLEFHYHDKYVVPDQADIEMQDVASMPSTIASIINLFFGEF